MNGVNYYQIFSLSPGASIGDLKIQYRKLSLTHHPDRGGSTEQMAQLNEAYRVLSNPLLRREYDQRQAISDETASEEMYHYTRPQPTAAQGQTYVRAHAYGSFWRWFVALALIGAVLLAYDIASTWIMPRYLTELPNDSSSLTPSGDLTEEAAAALSEMQNTSQNPVTPTARVPAPIIYRDPAPTVPSAPATSPSTHHERQRRAHSR